MSGNNIIILGFLVAHNFQTTKWPIILAKHVRTVLRLTCKSEYKISFKYFHWNDKEGENLICFHKKV